MSKPMRVIRYNPEVYNRQYRKKRKIKIIVSTIAGTAALVLIITSLFSMINDIKKEVNVSSGEYDTKKITFSEDDDCNILIMGFGADNTDLDYVTVIGFSPASDDVNLLTFSDYTSVPSVKNGKTLESIYISDGKNGVVSAVEKICGITVTGTNIFDFYGTSNFFNLFNGVQVNLDQSICYTPSEGIMGIIAAEGKRNFSGRELIRLFLYRDWENGEADRTRFITRTFAAVIDKNLSGGLKEQYDSLYTRIANTVKSDITATAYSEMSDKIFYLAKINENGEGICRVINLNGDLDKSKKQLELSRENVEGIKAFFKEQ